MQGNIADIVVDIQSSKVYEKKLKKTVHAGDVRRPAPLPAASCNPTALSVHVAVRLSRSPFMNYTLVSDLS